MIKKFLILLYFFLIATSASSKTYEQKFMDVETNSAVKLTTGTFKKLKNTKNLSEALQQTKVEMINDSKTSHPMFWAPFVLIGNFNQ